jgi:hypothetical protein
MLAPFAGRLGGNQSFILDRSNPANAELLRKVPDAAPNLNLKEMFDLGGFREVDMYKAAVVECFGTYLRLLPRPSSRRMMCYWSRFSLRCFACASHRALTEQEHVGVMPSKLVGTFPANDAYDGVRNDDPRLR